MRVTPPPLDLQCRYRKLRSVDRVSATAAPALGIDLPGGLHDGVEPGAQLLVRHRCVEVELRGERFEDRTDADTLLGGEAVPVIVGIIADVRVQGFSTVVV